MSTAGVAGPDVDVRPTTPSRLPPTAPRSTKPAASGRSPKCAASSSPTSSELADGLAHIAGEEEEPEEGGSLLRSRPSASPTSKSTSSPARTTTASTSASSTPVPAMARQSAESAMASEEDSLGSEAHAAMQDESFTPNQSSPHQPQEEEQGQEQEFAQQQQQQQQLPPEQCSHSPCNSPTGDDTHLSDEEAEEEGGASPGAVASKEDSGAVEIAQHPQPEAKAEEVALAKGKTKKVKVTFNALHCMYEVITRTVEAKGWKVLKTENKAPHCSLHWLDHSGLSDWFRKVEPWMKVNHYPGMHNALARKTCLARNMARMHRHFPVEYSFLPQTWIIPGDMIDLEKQFDETGKAKTIFISKPDAGTQGRGIFLTNELNKIKQAMNEREGLLVVQRYIAKPLLIDGMKFDLRLYFLVGSKLSGDGSLEPRLFLFRDGLVRLCTTEYVAPTSDNLDQKRMHLTNYAINKKSKDFVQNDGDDDGCGSKRSLRWFLETIAEEHGPKEREKLWTKLKGLCVKMVLAVWPTLEAEYHNGFSRDFVGGALGSRSFEVLGVDVMLDVKRRPYLIEVNHLPSFTCDSPLDDDIKSRVIQQTLDMVCRIDGTEKADYESALRGEAVKRRDDGENVLDAPSYQDFERAYPGLPNAPKAAARFEMIRSKVVEASRPLVYASGPTTGPGQVSSAQNNSNSNNTNNGTNSNNNSNSNSNNGTSTSNTESGKPPLHRPPSRSVERPDSSNRRTTPVPGTMGPSSSSRARRPSEGPSERADSRLDGGGSGLPPRLRPSNAYPSAPPNGGGAAPNVPRPRPPLSSLPDHRPPPPPAGQAGYVAASGVSGLARNPEARTRRSRSAPVKASRTELPALPPSPNGTPRAPGKIASAGWLAQNMPPKRLPLQRQSLPLAQARILL